MLKDGWATSNQQYDSYCPYSLIGMLGILWLIGCFVLGFQEERYDMLLWGFFVLLPAILSFIVIEIERKYHNVAPWKIVVIWGTGGIMYFLIMITELTLVFIIYNFDGFFPGFDLINSPWWLILILVTIFSFSIPALIEELGKFVICIITSNDENK